MTVIVVTKVNSINNSNNNNNDNNKNSKGSINDNNWKITNSNLTYTKLICQFWFCQEIFFDLVFVGIKSLCYFQRVC